MSVQITEQFCTKCAELKPIDQFTFSPSSKTGYTKQCKVCRKKVSQTYYAKNRDKYIQNSTDWQKKNKDRYRDLHYRRKFGITLDDYNRILEYQKHVCRICQQPEVKKGKLGGVAFMAVDHCHETNTIRGLLCMKCNVALGKFHESERLMRRAINYVNLNKQQPQYLYKKGVLSLSTLKKKKKNEEPLD